MSEDRARKAIDLFIQDNPDLGYGGDNRVDHFIADMIELHSDELKALVAREDARGPELIRRIRDLALTPKSIRFLDSGRRIKVAWMNGEQKQETIISAYEDDDVLIRRIKSMAGLV